jgi:hypothetical protein
MQWHAACMEIKKQRQWWSCLFAWIGLVVAVVHQNSCKAGGEDSRVEWRLWNRTEVFLTTVFEESKGAKGSGVKGIYHSWME